MKTTKIYLTILAISISSSAFAATSPGGQGISESESVFGYSTQLTDNGFVNKIVAANIEQTKILEILPVDLVTRDGAIKVAAEFKANENAKAISEFNALQDLAVKESDPKVKTLIKQAAHLKLESYRVAASTN